MFSSRKTAASSSGYNLTKSLRFRSSASATLSRTPASASNQQKWTLSTWVKRGTIYDATLDNYIFGAGSSGSNRFLFGFGNTTENLAVVATNSGSNVLILNTTPVYRDPSAWYHMVLAIDTTQATASNRAILYVNGVQVTAFSTATYPAQNTNLVVNATNAHAFGSRGYAASDYYDGYMTEINFVDGQQLTPSSFGSTNALTGVWQPAKYTGTYGTNGFYLPFTNTTSTTTLGYDFSGNSNNWTTNNISLTAGSTYDSMTDVPTLTSATVANYCVMNPLSSGSFNTISNANLKVAGNTATNNGNTRGTINFTTGKWYIEMTAGATSASVYPSSGIIPASNAGVPDNGGTNQVGYPSNSVSYEISGNKRVANSTSAYGSTYTTGDVIGIAIDADNGAIYFSKNGTFQNSGVPTSGGSKTGAAFTWTGGSIDYAFATAQYNGSDASFNFGQQPFTYTPPTGFVALNTYNLPTSTIVKGASYMNATLYNGNGGTQTIATGFQPDLTWIKVRNVADDHFVYDSNRGATLYVNTNIAGPEVTIANGLTAWTSNGFILGDSGSTNNASNNFVAWDWQAGKGSNNSNTNGSITSTVSVSATAGFSIALYSGNSTSGATVGHGLGVTPSMIIVKRRNATLAQSPNWIVYHASLGNTKALILDTTLSAQTATGFWNNTSPSSSVFTVGNDANTNVSTFNYVAYSWAEIAGFSKFGSYTGNGSADGPFVYCGFQPKWLMIKVTNTTDNWYVIDTVRQTYNVIGPTLAPNLSNAEFTLTVADVLSNGFKIRNSASTLNGNGNTVIYAAFASNPFKNSLAF
jgi:hypothetical protein